MTTGTLYQVIARFGFLISSYLIHVSMAYFLADPRDYGDLGVILGMVTMARVFLSTGLPQSTSRFIAMDPSNEGAIFATALKIQFLCSLGILVLYAAGTPIWTRLLNDTSLTRSILISSLLIPCMAVFQIYQAFLNGRSEFGLQALYTGIYAAGRFVFAIALVLLGLSIDGVLFGLILAVLVALVLIRVRVRRPSREGSCEARKLVAFSLPIVAFSIGITLLLNLDIMILKHYYPDDEIIGFYTGAMNFGKLPYFVLYSYSVTLLPTISQALGSSEASEASKVGKIVRKNITSLVVVGLFGTAFVGATAGLCLDFVYPSAYRAASQALILLFSSMCLLAVLHALASVITAAGKPQHAMVIVLLCVPVHFGLGVWLTPRYGMIGMATANLVSVAVGTAIAAVVVARRTGALAHPATLAKAVLACVVVCVGLVCLQVRTVAFLPVMGLASVVVFGLLMLLTGAITREQVSAVLDRVRKRSQ